MPTRLPNITFDAVQLDTLGWRLVGIHPEIPIAGYRVHLRGMPPLVLQPGASFTLQFPEAYEGLLVVAGACDLLTKTPQMLQPGSILLRPPEEQYQITVRDAPLVAVQFWLDITPALAIAPPPTWPRTIDLLWELALMLEDDQVATIGWQERMLGRLTVILSRIIALAGHAPFVAPDPAPAMRSVRWIDLYLEQHMAEVVRIREVADMMGMSVSAVEHLFRRKRGTSIEQYLGGLRMRRAAALLIDSDSPVSVIGREVGYTDPAYFSRRFTRFHGMSPRRFRAQQRAIVPTSPYAAR